MTAFPAYYVSRSRLANTYSIPGYNYIVSWGSTDRGDSLNTDATETRS
jgi:hypothetical protein